ncbi:MAG: ABC transporter ATP-binding protein [Cruoricaptor ignavus]|nr:ABC transporter ATP-binding protein [Cruoricaptor ignavus]
MSNAIDIKDLSFSYGKHLVLDKVNTCFPENQFSILLGVNGGGKSTLFKILSGLIDGFSGNIRFFGEEYHQLSRKERAKQIGFLSQNFTTIFPFSVQEILLTGRSAFSRFDYNKDDLQRVQAIAEKTHITHLLPKSFASLSGGQQQLVMIARVLVQNPRIILLDEPTNHLDIFHQHHLLKTLKSLTEDQYTVVAIMHNPSLAFQYADNIYYLYRNKIMQNSTGKTPDLELLKEIFSVDFFYHEQDERSFLTSLPF